MSRLQRPWRRLENSAADEADSIHDDERARALGFRGAFVPGSTVACAAIPLIFARYGQAWMEGGWFTFTFRTPVYTSEEVRAVAEDAADAEGRAMLALSVVTRDGRLCCSGSAGLGFRLPWAGQDEVWGDVFPRLERGFAFPKTQVVIAPADVADLLSASGDDTPWYRNESPWGGAVAPPEQVLPIALQTMQGTRVPLDEAHGPGIWSQHQLALREPLHYDLAYGFAQWATGKGETARTRFVEYQFEVTDGDRVVAAGRHQGKWLKDAAPRSGAG